jgi:hypothetical protein
MTACCQVGYSQYNILAIDDLPGAGESLVIDANSILTLNLGETATIEGNLYVNGTDGAIIDVQIMNYGELTIKSSSIICDHANLTIDNEGTLVIQNSDFVVKGNSTLDLDNMVDCSLIDTSIEVIGGYAYLVNTGSLTIQNGYFKDQLDGTFITNYAEAEMHETIFVVNGAKGKIEIFNSGTLQLTHNAFDVNYGGTVNMNSLTGNLTVTDCSMDVSGSSHGTRSQVNILADNATWQSCSFVNNGGLINYLNTGEVNVNDCTVSVSSVDASTILSSNGPMSFTKLRFSGSGSARITNYDSMTLIDSSFNSSHHLNLMNSGKLTAENWLMKTTSDTAEIIVYISENASIAFDVPFIENVSSEDLASVGAEGQDFVESSGGVITVTNKGLMEEQANAGLGLDYLLYVLIVVAAVAVSIVVILRNRKKENTD